MSGETIYAPSTVPGRAAIAVIRLSGPESFEIIEAITQRPVPTVRMLMRRDVFAISGDLIDQVMVVVFEDGASFTGERVAEIQCHGGVSVVSAILDRIDSSGSCRLAEAGEFTKRAFQNGRMDLTEVEGLSDLLSAQTELQRRQAMRSVSGEAAEMADRWRSKLIEALALLQLTIDWVDEDVPQDVFPEVRSLVADVLTEIQSELSLADQTERMRLGFEVAIVGAPNVGKSTLLNTLAGRQAAITSDVPGTTRDVIEVSYDLDGFPLRFLDTAGIRETSDEIEHQGVALALQRARDADLRIFMASNDCASLRGDFIESGAGDIDVWSKSDLSTKQGVINLSCLTGDGVDELLLQLKEAIAVSATGLGLFGHERRRSVLEKAGEFLDQFQREVGAVDIELSVEEVRAALDHLDTVIGRVGVEDVLGAVFSRFCLGK